MLLLNLERAGQRNVAVKMAFVKLVEDDRRHARQRLVLDQLPKQNAFGLELDARSPAREILEPNLIAHFAPEFHAQFLRHARSQQSRREPARLENDNLAVAEQSVLEQHLRHLG